MLSSFTLRVSSKRCGHNLRFTRGFRCLVVEPRPDKATPPTHVIKDVQDVDEVNPLKLKGDHNKDQTVVKVKYSTLNYKDGMVLQGLPGVAKGFPIIPGIDFVGQVQECNSGAYKPGDWVVQTGQYAGQHIHGGYSEIAKVPTQWLVPLPSELTAEESMIIGTAGFTAFESVDALERFLPTMAKRASILVTGASGGVGSTAVSILKNLGYDNVTVSTGRVEENSAWLKDLGAKNVIGRIEDSKPLDKELYDAVIDSVGGKTLANVLPLVRYGGAVAACGVAAGPKVETTVFPFILRGVSLLGIDSVQLPMEPRKRIWSRIAQDFPKEYFTKTEKQVVGLKDLFEQSTEILQGKVKGRVLVDVSK